MKKIIFILIIILSGICYASNYDETKLRDDFSEMVVKHQNKITNETSYESEDLWKSSCDWVSPWSSARYHTYLIKDITYVVYTLTDGPPVKVCWRSKYGSICKPKNNKFIFYFKPKKTGKYYYHVDSVSMDKKDIGIHISLLTMLFKKGTSDKKIQRLTNFILKD